MRTHAGPKRQQDAIRPGQDGPMNGRCCPLVFVGVRQRPTASHLARARTTESRPSNDDAMTIRRGTGAVPEPLPETRRTWLGGAANAYGTLSCPVLAVAAGLLAPVVIQDLPAVPRPPSRATRGQRPEWRGSGRVGYRFLVASCAQAIMSPLRQCVTGSGDRDRGVPGLGFLGAGCAAARGRRCRTLH